jgi:ribA/ribD-fused uncharacterized protein
VISSFTGQFRFLSNFHPAPVHLDGAIYPTVEHAYQAAKCQNPADRNQIRLAASPGEAKRLGRTVAIRDDWDAVKLRIMEDLLRQKFATDPLRTMLRRTDEAPLVEGNYWGDVYWGVWNGHGENHLGRLLMKIRAELGSH